MKKEMSKQVQKYLNIYLNSSDYELLDVYERPSSEKHKIYKGLKTFYNDNWDGAGNQPKILTFNSHYFTCGFIGYNKETGQQQFILDLPSKRIITDINI